MNTNYKYTIEFEYTDGDKCCCNFFSLKGIEDWLKDAGCIIKPNWVIKPIIR